MNVEYKSLCDAIALADKAMGETCRDPMPIFSFNLHVREHLNDQLKQLMNATFRPPPPAPVKQSLLERLREFFAI
jgi:hypothetical protein